MSRPPYQYNFYNKNLNQQSSTNPNAITTPTQQSPFQTIQSLKTQLKQKQSLISQLSSRLQQQQRLLQQKEFVLKQKQLQLQYIHKQNQQLHQKIFQLNQRLNAQRADIKQTIKHQVSMLKQQFNFMIKENQTKTQIILQQKEKQYQRKQQDLKAMIKQLSQRGSHNGSFYYQQSHHSNIIKAKHINNSSYYSKQNYNNSSEIYENQQEKPSTANSILKNSRESYKSNLAQSNSKVLTSLRESIVGESNGNNNSSSKMLNKDNMQSKTFSVANLLNLKQGGTSQNQSQVTGRFGFAKTPITSKFSVRHQPNEPSSHRQSSRQSSRPNIDQIISRSKRQLNQRSKKSSMTQLPKPYPPLNTSSNTRLVRKRFDDLDNSRSSISYGIDQLDQKRKSQKLKEISSLKMKVNMLKTQLKEEISFCQHSSSNNNKE